MQQNLKKIKHQLVTFGSKNVAVKHYKSKHGFIPFWILSKCLTMGVIRDFFDILKPNDQSIIINKILNRKISKKPVKKAKSMIALFADIRNMCAHDEMLLGYVHERITISHLDEHDLINCKKNKNGQIIQGKSDLLALIICIKYFVNRTMYNEFIQDLSSSINKCFNKISHCVTKDEFLDFIGLSNDYETLKRL